MSRTIQLAAVAALCLTAVPAAAHVTFEVPQSKPGATYKAVVRVPHGCEGSTTLKVRVKIPDGFYGVKPMPHPGWEMQTVTGKYAKPYDNHGASVSEGVTEITWTGKLLDAHYDEFVFRGSFGADIAPGTTVYFPVVQDCEKGSARWIEIPAAGQSADSLKMPAPGVKIVAP